ncbi:MAG: hypothetical protein QOC72_2042 [Methylobacteriaceae bacterium]|jgi:hypothetical protein|nr:hypothetical protein [Methylobacteriaceae bacterium]
MHNPALSHLRLRLQGIHRVLRAAVIAQIERAAHLARADLTPLCITEDEALHLLADADRFVSETRSLPTPSDAAPDHDAEAALRAQAREMGLALPLDTLVRRFDLSEFEQFAILVCAATEFDRSYERLFAFILDDLSRRTACLELLTLLAAHSFEDRATLRHALSRHGKLRRCGLLIARGEASEPRLELRVADGLADYLAGDGSDLLCRDPMITPESPRDTRAGPLARAIASGAVRIAGIWGSQHSAKEDFVHTLGAALGKRLRPWTIPGDAVLASFHDAAQEAGHDRGLLWISADHFDEPANRATAALIGQELAHLSVCTVITGEEPWRPAVLLARSAYTEIELPAVDLAARGILWAQEMPELEREEAAEMATRLRLVRQDVRAAVHMARVEGQIEIAPARRTPFRRLQQATVALAAGRSREFAKLIRPKRGPDDLILPQAVHRQVMEIAQFFRAWPMVAETWGFGRLATGEGGIKALFTGDSGTGKTLAAEVIARELHLPLLRVELSRVVSKWVGETEKNLEAAFAEAEDGQAVLLFDEADALFGKRGEVESGVDRYANLEVSYLLQRLDDHGGLVLLATNLKDNIDNAFTRRFQSVVHFPRPERTERLRIWRMAFPDEAPIDPSIDFETLANLDLTGAGIVGAARTAALFAAEDGSSEIGKPHVVRAIARQFRREARLLTPVELGPYANLLQEVR